MTQPDRTNLWQRLGPGILLAATSIGASHLVLSPQAGALFGYSLLWLVVASHLFKYPAFEFGPRYAAATGTSLLAGYRKVPGPRNWALYLFLLSTVVQGGCVLAGVVSVSGAVLSTWTGAWNNRVFSLVVAASVLLLLFTGGFAWLEQINKIMMAVLALATVMAFVPVFPSPEACVHLVVPELPSGSIVLTAAILGWMPTGIDVSVWHSFWTLEKFKQLELDPGEGQIAVRKTHLRIALADMRAGYILSLLTGVMFVTLGAALLSGRGAELKGVQFAQAISTAYTQILGRWMYHVFMLTAFFAMFSTSYTVVDGFSRSFSEGLAALKPGFSEPAARKKTYGGFVLASTALACAMLLWVGNPVHMVTAAALLSLAVAPVLYGLNLYCVSRHIQDPSLKPSRPVSALAVAGVVFMTLAVAVTVYVKVIR